jgi:hypothetical protein
MSRRVACCAKVPARGSMNNIPAKRPWKLLVLLLLVYVHNQWSRNALQYSVNFAVAPSADTAREFVNIALGISKAQYAVLASYAFILLYTIFSLLSGIVLACTRASTRALGLFVRIVLLESRQTLPHQSHSTQH